jgi:hypothetical protein
MTPWTPHLDPLLVRASASKSLPAGELELAVSSAAGSNAAVLGDPDVVIVSVNDGSGWRAPTAQLPAGWSLDTYRANAHKPRSLVRRAGDGVSCYVWLAPAETPTEYAARKRAWARDDDDARRRASIRSQRDRS